MIDWEQVKTNKKGESVYIGGRFSKEDSSWMRKKRTTLLRKKIEKNFGGTIVVYPHGLQEEYSIKTE